MMRTRKTHFAKQKKKKKKKKKEKEFPYYKSYKQAVTNSFSIYGADQCDFMWNLTANLKTKREEFSTRYNI